MNLDTKILNFRKQVKLHEEIRTSNPNPIGNGCVDPSLYILSKALYSQCGIYSQVSTTHTGKLLTINRKPSGIDECLVIVDITLT